MLKHANAKRERVAPRVGRVGLPDNVPNKTANVDCCAYFARLKADPTVQQNDRHEKSGTFKHSWPIGSRMFTKDLLETLNGDTDRQAIVARQVGENGALILLT